MTRIDPAIAQAVKDLPKGIMVFRFSEVHEELRVFREVVAERLTPTSLKLINRLLDSLEQAANVSPGRSISWSTGTNFIETVPSEGCHQVGRAGRGRNLKAQLHFLWQIEPCGAARRKMPMSRVFALRNSSIKVRFVDAESDSDVACWDFDVGDHVSPGCHFHAKYSAVSEQDRRSLVDIDVPRLPSIMVMLTDAIEYVLGELWQEEWRQFAAGTTPQLNAWRPFPKRRMLNILRWYSQEVQNAKGTPWSHLKRAKPECFILWDES